MPRPSAQARRLCAAAAAGRARSIARTCAPRPPSVRPPRRPACAPHQQGAGPASTSSRAAGALLHLRHSAASAPQAQAASACPTAHLSAVGRFGKDRVDEQRMQAPRQASRAGLRARDVKAFSASATRATPACASAYAPAAAAAASPAAALRRSAASITCRARRVPGPRGRPACLT